MELLPETRALLGIDVIASADNPGYHLGALWRALAGMLNQAFADTGIDAEEVIESEPTGDGALYTLSSRRLGTLMDFSKRLDELAAEHNRERKPDVRLRIAVDLGAVGDVPSYYSAKISRGRLLDAPAFKSILTRCLAERPDVNSGLILSMAAFRQVFGGDYTHAVRESEFAEVTVTNKSFREQAWLHVPGFDARSLRELAAEPNKSEPAAPQVNNQVNGTVNGVQAGTINGAVSVWGDH
ncbi:hypothetical protein ORV05_03055 [Amycolatopsis cynarae]|uniref:Uncharacterized protein n=1 Tax=Amycolatopsis cynarae TaxID=2995223 RepID=A0ABY7B3B2_9PSEU|nr:hypothetical protein [Amycolatopsis sp. HUAS 11-8]WAL66806.1 hypothetical protein ORV05_03055 [Amycolatopsis sp. HUAS 11-8]